MTNKIQEDTQMVTVNGVRLAYEIHGTGEIPLVMVHGGFLSRRNWDWVVPHLADSFRVLTYDQRGYGESERPRGQGGIREHVGDLAALSTRPALLTLGDQTAPMFPPIITKLAGAMPSAEVQEFTGAGHPIMAEQPEDFAEAITAFVRRHTT